MAPDTLLLVVGMQNDKFIHSSDNNLLERVNRSIRAAMTRGWLVVFALDLHHPHHVSFQPDGHHCVLQTWGAQMVHGLEYYMVPRAEMVVRGLDKNQDSDDAFYVSKPSSPSRLRHLLSSSTKRMCVCGSSPDGCIEETVTTASLNGYCMGDPVIISDCCSTVHNSQLLVFKTLDELLLLWDN